MGWLNTLLDVGIISMQVNERHRLQQLQRRFDEAVLIQEIVSALRNEIFKFKQAAEEILRLESENGKIAAGAMHLLESRLDRLGLSPELFSELSDKDYVASTTRLIQDNCTRMLSQLSAEDQTEVNSLTADFNKLADYTYYLENHEAVNEFMDTSIAVEELKIYNSSCLILVLFLGGVFGVPLLWWWIFGDKFLTGAIICMILSTISILYFRFKIMRPIEFKKAKKRVRELEDEVDLDYFDLIEERVGKDPQQMAQQQAEIQQRINSFFQSSNLADMLP